jgi:hypothetical protein
LWGQVKKIEVFYADVSILTGKNSGAKKHENTTSETIAVTNTLQLLACTREKKRSAIALIIIFNFLTWLYYAGL